MTVKNILITGGCGFIGTSLIGFIKNSYFQGNIRIIDNLSIGSIDDLSEVTVFSTHDRSSRQGVGNVNFVEGDIRDSSITDKCTKGIDYVVHLAANTGVKPSVSNPLFDMENNILGTLNLLESSRRNNVKRFIFASSGAPIGDTQPPIHEELAPHPVSPYGASKLAGEGYCSAYYRSFGLPTICLRFGNVYGPRSRRKSSVVAHFIKQAISGSICTIYGDGNQTRDFIYIDDLLQAIWLSLNSELGGEIFQIATGVEKTVNEVGKIVKKNLHKFGINMKISYDSPRIGDVKRNYSDTRKAKRLLNWSPKVSIDEGIYKTVQYFLKGS